MPRPRATNPARSGKVLRQAVRVNSERSWLGQSGSRGPTGESPRDAPRNPRDTPAVGFDVFYRFVWLVVTAAALFVLYQLSTGPQFQVRQVVVTGARSLSATSVTAAANLTGANAFTSSTAAAQARVLDLGVPLRASISYRLPSTALITIVERTPAFIWKVDPTLYLVADDGTVLGPTTTESQKVIVVDSDRRPVTVGKKVDPSILREAAYLDQALPIAANLVPHYFLYSQQYGLIVPTANGIQVAIGGDDNLVAKLQNFQPTLYVASAQKPLPSLVDLRFPNHSYFR